MQAFCLYCNEQLKAVSGHYDLTFKLLQQQANANLQQYPRSESLRQLGLMILNRLNESVHSRYKPFSPEDVAPEHIDALKSGFIDKVLCGLSADQLGIVLKSAFDVKLILGKSLRKVQGLAPLLSTL